MKHVLAYLEHLDLSEIEARLYLKLLETGPISVRELAKITEVKRTTTYLYIDKLVEKGLLIKVVKGSQKQIAAVDPKDSLPYLVEKKFQTAMSVQKDLPNILKTIHVLLPEYKDFIEAEIKYFKGTHGIKRIYDEALKGKELRLYAKLSEIAPILPNDDKDLFENALKENKELKIYEIYGDSQEEIKQFSYTTNSDRYFYKFMPPDVKLGSSVHLIYDNKVAIIDVRGKKAGIVLHSSEHYINSKTLFDFIWRMLPQVNSH